MMTVKDALTKYSKIDETDLFLSHLLKCSKTDLYLNPQRKLTKVQQQKLVKMISQLKRGLPVAYILGYKYFYGLKFTVNKNVLIPRPESEWLVDEAVKYGNKRSGKKLTILDLGTGSGCLAITVAKQFGKESIRITASDISTKALTVAKQNAKSNTVKINFVKSDLFNKLPQKFDLIIANLPYVPSNKYKKYFSNLKFEPKQALVDSKGDFYLYEQLLKNFDGHIQKNGMLLLEIDPKTKPVLEKLVKKYNPKLKIHFYKDLQKLWRYAILKS